MKSHLNEIKSLDRSKRMIHDLTYGNWKGEACRIKDMPKEEIPLLTFEEMANELISILKETGAKTPPGAFKNKESLDKFKKFLIKAFTSSGDIEKINIGSKHNPEYKYRFCP